MSDASDVEQFFNWINKTKHLKPCYQSIDMRGKVSAPCSRFMMNERVHYLDQKSFGIFQALRSAERFFAGNESHSIA